MKDRVVPPTDAAGCDGLIRMFSEMHMRATGKPSPQVRFVRKVNRFRIYHRNGRRWAEYSALGLLNKVVTLREIARDGQERV